MSDGHRGRRGQAKTDKPGQGRRGGQNWPKNSGHPLWMAPNAFAKVWGLQKFLLSIYRSFATNFFFNNEKWKVYQVNIL